VELIRLLLVKGEKEKIRVCWGDFAGEENGCAAENVLTTLRAERSR
jgi:hypothetical protein